MDAIYRTMDALCRTFIDGPFELIIAAFIVTAAGCLGYDPGRVTAEPWNAELEEVLATSASRPDVRSLSLVRGEAGRSPSHGR